MFGEMLREEMGDGEFDKHCGDWVGNCQFRPFDKAGPVAESAEPLRGVTLFELEDFVDMADREDKYVVLLARGCTMCDRPVVESLRPLFEQPSLKVWSHVVLDSVMATGLLNPPEKTAST